MRSIIERLGTQAFPRLRVGIGRPPGRMDPAAYVLLAVFRFATAASASTTEAGALMGTQERAMGYAFLFWVIALAVHLLLSSRAADSGIGG
jgi:hypothetical protein